jgi:hypothetical protein
MQVIMYEWIAWWKTAGVQGTYPSAARVAQGIQRGTRQRPVKSKGGPEPFDAELARNAWGPNQIKSLG